jgi:hypothetical protein
MAEPSRLKLSLNTFLAVLRTESIASFGLDGKREIKTISCVDCLVVEPVW